MTLLSGFKPIIGGDCRVLILGSMPGVTSLRQQQYYAHPRNAFWSIIKELLGIDKNKSYNESCSLLTTSGVALWDVLNTCRRPGSLDSNIEPGSESVNDFGALFSENKAIRAVFFNGGTAEKLYKKHVLDVAKTEYCDLIYQRLPSSSPAYAAMSYEEKLKHWRDVLNYL